MNGAFYQTYQPTNNNIFDLIIPLSLNTEYTFNVSAFDAAGNVSGLSNTLHVITTPYSLHLNSNLTSRITYNAFAFPFPDSCIWLENGFKFSALSSQYDFDAKFISGQQQWTTSKKNDLIVPESNVYKNNEQLNNNFKSDNLSNNLNVVFYPNPTKDKLFIEGLSDFEANVFDLYGRKLIHLINVNGSIDISKLNSGTYLVQLKGAGQTFMQKIIKQ